MFSAKKIKLYVPICTVRSKAIIRNPTNNCGLAKKEEERKNKALFDLFSASNLSHPIRSYFFRPSCFALKKNQAYTK